jgi:Lariat debranching enzyme, C-terminal domain
VPSLPPSAPVTAPPTLTYDREWLAISRALHPYLSTEIRQPSLPPIWDMAPLIEESQRWVDDHVGEREIGHIQEFVMTAPGPIDTSQRPPRNIPAREYSNLAVVDYILIHFEDSQLVYESTNRGLLHHVGTREQGQSSAAIGYFWGARSPLVIASLRIWVMDKDGPG